MKTLYLVRHAKSSWKKVHLSDIDRPLNSRGKRDAPFMGALLHEKGIKPNLLISSPAKRARKTAVAFAKALNYPKSEIKQQPKIYEASVADLFFVIKGCPDDLDSIMLFGHNFSYTEFANIYAKPNLDNVPTTGVVAIEFRVDQWKDITAENGKMLFFEYPKKYFSK
ncbi:MAG: phosphohistidine phosphatase [Aureispira sp.]|jgi:phosphohistidine phosphatase